jgi:two-component system chemotaxis response regulator CheY
MDATVAAGELSQMSKKILITDDTLFMRVTLKTILKENGFDDVIEACNGQEAVDQYAAHKPDLVLMDITMPIKDGLTALKEIRLADPNATVVMCTAMGQKNVVIEAVQSGAKDFIVKPFQPDRVIESVRKHLEAA